MKITMTLRRLLGPFCLLVLLILDSIHATPDESREYLVVGVSGGLQDGFPDHFRLDFHSEQPDESRAILLGRALVRGYKAYLDVMQEGWRQYTPEPGQPLINSNVFASGCFEHANEYWIYLVDARQVMAVLNNEPRFLSITPDTGMLELDANETYPAVRDFVRLQISTQGKSDMKHAAVPLVTAVWFHDSHVPSPPIRTHPDGTQVTNFPESLALWAGVNDTDRTSLSADDRQRFWDGIRKAVRNAEQNRPTKKQLQKYGPPFKCKKNVRFGVGPDTARINYPFSVDEITTSISKIGYRIDYLEGELYSLEQTATKEEL